MSTRGDVVVDGRVDREKLAELLNFGAERQELEFKATLDLSADKNGVDCVHDLLGLMSLTGGGYMIVGVDDRGEPAWEQDEITQSHFDSATLHQKVQPFVDGLIDIRSAVHRLADGAGRYRDVALIFCGPPPSGWPLVVKKEGSYPAQGPSRDKRIVLRVGQVVVRDGTSHTPLTERHWPRLLADHDERIRAEARRDIDVIVTLVRDLLSSTGPIAEPVDDKATVRRQAPKEPVSAALLLARADVTLDTYSAAVATVVESGSTARLDGILRDAAAELRVGPNANDEGHGSAALDRAFIVALTTMLYGSEDQFDRAMRVIEGYYDSLSELPERVHHIDAGEVGAVEAWREIAVRLYVLGAEAVHERKWTQLRRLALHRYGPPDAYGYVSWIRHAVTTAARAEPVMIDAFARSRADAMISRALSVIAATPDLAPDLNPGRVNSAAAVRKSTTALDRLCWFDVMWCTIAYVESRRESDFYPSSAGFGQEHAFPAFELLVRDEGVRRALFPLVADTSIAEAIEAVVGVGQNVSRHQPGFDWWSGLPDEVTAWIDANSA